MCANVDLWNVLILGLQPIGFFIMILVANEIFFYI